MVTIRTTDDFLRAMDENPTWKEAVRRAILTEQLLNLPARFDEFTAEQRRVNAEQQRFNAEQRQTNADVKASLTRLDQFIEEQREFNSEQRQTNADVKASLERLDNRFVRLGEDIGTMKAYYSRSETARYADCIVHEMGFRRVRTLSQGDLIALESANDTADLASGVLTSYRRADLVMEATDAAGATHYVVVEVSFTADERDTTRALRNARLITRFTGHPAHAAIASVRNVREIQHFIDSGQVFWYELGDRSPPEEE